MRGESSDQGGRNGFGLVISFTSHSRALSARARYLRFASSIGVLDKQGGHTYSFPYDKNSHAAS